MKKAYFLIAIFGLAVVFSGCNPHAKIERKSRKMAKQNHKRIKGHSKRHSKRLNHD